MINLRYHIVSVVAVFLALGIGLALGSTFVDSILVNELEDQVNEFKMGRDEAIEIKDQAVADKKSAQEESEVLRSKGLKDKQSHDTELEDLRRSSVEEINAIRDERDAGIESTTLTLDSIETLMPRGHLEGTSWTIVAPTGIDLLAMSEIREILTRSDGDYLGTLWMRPTMSFQNLETSAALADLFSVEPGSAEVLNLTISHVASWLTANEKTESDSGLLVDEFIEPLTDLGLVRYDRFRASTTFDQVASTGNRIIFLNDVDHMDLHEEIVIPLLQELSGRGHQGVGAVIELASESSSIGQVVNKVRNDLDLAEDWSTFDEVDTLEGRLGLVIGLSRLPEVGHYGKLPTAEGRFPR
ncbi:MAG TPA: hypothetical protein DCL16_05705 [Acidimicrobiaceae bacterium]|nr:hypothetical protein [Acidimicrobiaceae bacterium]